jgi:hypothetical protein
MFEILDNSKKSLNLLLRENDWKPLSHLPFGNSETLPVSLQRRLIKKFQRPIGLSNSSLRDVSLLDEIMKILPNLLIPQFLRGSMKMKGKPLDTGQINGPCTGTIIL